ncbi:MAG: twin-arginine translocase TatA/TatE family subunit [Blastocatellia bacterium]|jgi:sec-independent protein translocase protein TatA
MMGLGMPEMVIILLIIIVLFGSRKIPELAKGLGEGIRNFKSGIHGDDQRDIDDRRYRDDDRKYREDERREEHRRTS